MGMSATWVESTKAELRAKGFQFRTTAPGQLAHRWVGQGPEPADAAPLLAELKDRVWMEWALNEASEIHEAWVSCCYTLAEMLGWPATTARNGETVWRGEDSWIRFLHRAAIGELREMAAALQKQMAAISRPAPVGGVAIAGRLL